MLRPTDRAAACLNVIMSGTRERVESDRLGTKRLHMTKKPFNM